MTASKAALFYRDRTWPQLIDAAEVARADPGELGALRRWLPAGRIDQQAADATAMLRQMRGFLAGDPAPQQASWTMSDTAMWEVARRRADARPADEAPAGSPVMLERVLDEIRLLGPDAFDAACCRGLLRVFAAAFARREGLTVDRAWLDGAVAEFKTSRNLEQDTQLARFLADSELPADDFERLIATNEMVRWACGQAGPDAAGEFLDDLRLSGEYPRLAGRARAKLDHDAIPDAPAEDRDAISWYFAERRGTAVPDDLADYARSCGFPDEQAFRTAVRREYRYVHRGNGHCAQ